MRIQQSFHRHRASSGREGRTARIFPSPKVGICVNKRDIFIVSGQRHVCRFSETLRLCLTPIFVQDKCNGLLPSRQQTLEENPSRTSAFAQDKLVTPLGMRSLGGIVRYQDAVLMNQFRPVEIFSCLSPYCQVQKSQRLLWSFFLSKSVFGKNVHAFLPTF